MGRWGEFKQIDASLKKYINGDEDDEEGKEFS
jgi:hypothetical protein